MKLVDYSNRRAEPRFHPGAQKLRWQLLDDAPKKWIGWMRDISLSGISFDALVVERTPRLHERLEVQQFPGGRPSFYEVMWVNRQKGKNIFGCSRIFPSPRLSKARIKPLPAAQAIVPEEEYMAQAA